MTSQQQLVCDSSTPANFKQWAKAISDFFLAAGWVQASDTGQVNWTSIGAVPGAGAYVYEIWKPGDGLTLYYVKMEYGNITGAANCPSLRITISSATDGAGNATGFFMGGYRPATSAFTTPSTTTQYECNFSGDSGSIRAMLWRNGINNCQQAFVISRSVDGTGARTGAYVTVAMVGCWTALGNAYALQQSLVFGKGVAPGLVNSGNGGSASNATGWAVRVGSNAVTAGTAFNSAIALDLISPMVGYYDYPCPDAGVMFSADVQEGVPFQATVYGAARTYIPARGGSLGGVGACGTSQTLCMRYD